MSKFVIIAIVIAAVAVGMVAIPVMQQAVQADKGGIPNEHASPKARGHVGGSGGCGVNCGGGPG